MDGATLVANNPDQGESDEDVGLTPAAAPTSASGPPIVVHTQRAAPAVTAPPNNATAINTGAPQGPPNTDQGESDADVGLAPQPGTPAANARASLSEEPSELKRITAENSGIFGGIAPFTSDALAGVQTLFGGGDYSSNKASVDAYRNELQQQYPMTSLYSTLAGAAMSPLNQAAGNAGAGIADATAPYLGKTLGAGLGYGITGAGLGAAYGAGEGVSPYDRAMNAGKNALLAGGLGVIAPPLSNAISYGAGKVANLATRAIAPYWSGNEAAISQIAADRAGNAGSLIGDQDVAPALANGQPLVGADYGGEGTRRLARLQANASPEAKAALTSVVQPRFNDQASRGQDFLEGMFGPNISGDAAKDNLRQMAINQNKPAYAAAIKAGSNGFWDPSYDSLLQAPAMQKAISDSSTIAANEAAVRGTTPPNNPFASSNGKWTGFQQNGQPAMPTTQYWDYVKRGLDSQIQTARRAGDMDTARQVGNIKDALLAPLDKAFPEYAQAREGAYQMFGADNALDAGRNILKQNITPDMINKVVNNPNITPLQQKALAYGAASALNEKIGNLPDNRSITNLFNTPNIREKLTAAMGEPAVNKLEAYMRVEGAMNALKGAVTGNSTTAEQVGAWAKAGLHHLAGPIGGAVLGAGEGAYHEGMDPTAIARHALWGAAAGAGERFLEGRNNLFGKGVIDALTSSNPDVYFKAIESISQRPQQMQALRHLTGYIVNATAANGPTAMKTPTSWLPAQQ